MRASPTTAQALLATPGAWVTPEHAGRGGHPIIIRDIPAHVGIEARRVTVNDDGVLANLDTREDLARARKRIAAAPRSDAATRRTSGPEGATRARRSRER